jgi:viroplasmin and RNaseH domain-containing protein
MSLQDLLLSMVIILYINNKELINFLNNLDDDDYIYWTTYLLENKFIKEKKEETVSVGTRFIINDEEYILASIPTSHSDNYNANNLGLICLADGNVWGRSLKVKDFLNVTKQEFFMLLGTESNKVWKSRRIESKLIPKFK